MTIIRDTYMVDGVPIEINIELDEADTANSFYDHSQRSVTDVLTKTQNVFRQGLNLARDCASMAYQAIQDIDMAIRPSEFEIQLAIKLNTETGAILTKLGAEAQLQVKMLWKHK
ncbi:CU044_2847 family protein [Herpetosiphon geysericola]|uniref:Trypsin-co-occurring domain-containing protein n=1 Tax=Herpetosiphon geysericola TaxID=70996 RepID=A0A0P6YUU3_9CHLR|nr:CU044_2847 family protein [Herpetosiphon geysericola]KPL87573.1 hypothetical protein SE18_10970 [Herpetosiphon geysericola]